MSHDCCVALPRGAMSLSDVVIVIFPYHTHFLFLTVLTIDTNMTIFGVFSFYCSKFAAKLTFFFAVTIHTYLKLHRSDQLQSYSN